MAPRISGPVRRSRFVDRAPTSFENWKYNRENMPIEQRAFWNWMTVRGAGALGSAAEIIPEDEYRVLSKGASGGGFFVPTDLADLITSAARAASPIAQLATEFVTQTGSTLNAPIAGTHGTAAWVAESGTTTATDETITNQALSAFKSSTKIICSEELLTDEAVDLDAYLASELGGRLGANEGAGFATGTGTGQALGITTAGNGISIVQAAVGSTTTFKMADILAFYKALPSAYRPSAAWVFNPDSFANLAATTDTAGGLAIQSLSFSPPSLLGLPVFLDGNLAAPAANAKSAVIMSKQAYAVRRVQGVLVQRLDELHADTGQIGYRGISRTDGRVLLADAARVLQNSAT